MDYKILIEKYWEGATSVEEEQALKAYFNSDKVSEEHLQYAPLFQYFGKSKEKTLNTSTEELLKPKNRKGKGLKIQSKLISLRRIAAVGLLLLAMNFIYTQYLNQPTEEERLASYWAEKEIKDPQLAYKKTKAALLMVSKKLNGGTASALNQVRKVQQISPLNVKTK